MLMLVIGIAVFFCIHAVTMNRPLRASLIERLGEGPYKGLYSLVSIAGFAMLVWGFVLYRQGGYIPLWEPPAGMRHATMALMLPALIALAAFMLPAGRIKSMLRHPMLVAIKLWALGHLLSNGDLGSLLVFGSFLVFAVVDRISLKRRGGAQAAPVGWNLYDGAALGIGVVLYFALVYFLHAVLFGVPVLAGR